MILTCCHHKIHRGNRSKISHKIQIERVKTQSPYSTNDDAFNLDYDHEFDGKFNGTHKYSNTNVEDIDDENSNDSLSFDIGNENDNGFTVPMQSKPKLGNIPSQSSVLHFEYTNSVSIGLMHQSQNNKVSGIQQTGNQNEKDGKSLSIDQHKMVDLNEGAEIGEKSRNGKGYSFLSDDDGDGSVEEMYNHHKKVTLGGIDENYDEEMELEQANVNLSSTNDKEEDEGLIQKYSINLQHNHSDANSDNEVLYGHGLPKIHHVTLMESGYQQQQHHETTTTTTTTNGYDGIDATTEFEKYPSLPPELSEDARSRAN